MSKKPTSARLQLKQMKENHPEDFEDKDHCVLFFMEDLKYSLVERKTIDREAKVMSTVSVKISGKKYSATLMFIGNKEECQKRMEALEGALSPEQARVSQSPKRKKDAIDWDISNEMKKLEKLGSSVFENQEVSSDDDGDDESQTGSDYHHHVPSGRNFPKANKIAKRGESSSDDDNWRDMITRKIDCILNKVDFIESHLNVTSTEWDRRVATPPDSKKMRHDGDQGEQLRSSSPLPLPSLMYNETNLLLLPSGGDLKKYALKVFANLFSLEEMANGIVEPARGKATGKVELDPYRVDLLKRAIQHKFGDAQMNKKWPQIRLSLNQKCLDSKRKFLIVEGDVNKSTD